MPVPKSFHNLNDLVQRTLWQKLSLIGLAQGCGNTMPDLSNLSHFPENKQEILIYLVWDKEFIALAKKSIQIMI